MITEERQAEVRRKAMRLLEVKDRTEKELTDRLRRAGFTEEEAEDALAYVKSYGYVNDYRYACNYISYRLQEKSRSRLFMDLAGKGIARDAFERAWDEVTQDQEADECELIRRAVQRKAEPGSRLDSKKMRSLQGFLLRRGFHYEDISKVLNEMNITLDREGQFGRNNLTDF